MIRYQNGGPILQSPEDKEKGQDSKLGAHTFDLREEPVLADLGPSRKAIGL